MKTVTIDDMIQREKEDLKMYASCPECSARINGRIRWLQKEKRAMEKELKKIVKKISQKP